MLSVDKGCPGGALPVSSTASPSATFCTWSCETVERSGPMQPVLPNILDKLPSCLSLVAMVLKHCKICFKQLNCPASHQYPFPCNVASPRQLLCTMAVAAADCLCSLEFLSLYPLFSILIRNVHNSVFVISICCLRPNYTICSGLSNASHLLCEKQFKDPRLASTGLFLLWSGKIRVMAGSAQHELFCLTQGAGCQQQSKIGSCCANTDGVLHIPRCSPETVIILNWDLWASCIGASCILPSFLYFPLFFHLNFLLVFKHFLVAEMPATFFFKENSWFTRHWKKILCA